jgi:hypothetical protein
VLTEDWFYCYPPTGEVFRVPRTYATDFASIPAAARSIVNPFGEHAEAALIHDWLYAVGEPNGRKRADDIFLYAMEEQEVGYVQRTLMYRAVRAFGASAYGAKREWRNFVDPDATERVAPPFERPGAAAVARINCEEFEDQLPELEQQYGTPREPKE